ncbi:MAG: hypothetical protein OEZ29_01630 [Candidatus Bathyarchaeota archaeon]|nr:hypothetical protein [Candidatus Bathyarchaeota archaeon]MDH5779277.1 hypothetical protein [Candidatus Bathyarchaeota archaeon]
MNSVYRAIKEDVKAALEAFKNDSFGAMNTLSNRIMANAIFDSDKKLILPGFFLKDVAFVFGTLKIREKATAFSTAKSYGFKYVKEIDKLVTDPIDDDKLWKGFHDFHRNIRKFQMSDFEEASYSENIEFTKKAFNWLLDYMDKEKNVLFEANNLFLDGIINEMSRILRVHSGELTDIFALSLIRALERYYDYFRRKYTIPSKGVDQKRVINEIFPFIGKIRSIYTEKKGASEVGEILWELVKGWREFFIQYMELPTARLRLEKEVERGIELPAEVKKKLTESVTKTLEKEIS